MLSRPRNDSDKFSLSRHDPREVFKIKPANRFPYFIVDGASIYAHLSAPKCHLLIFSDGQTDFSAVETVVAENYSNLIDYRSIPLYPHIAEIFGATKTFTVFVRPDNHVGFITGENPVEELDEYLPENLKIK